MIGKNVRGRIIFWTESSFKGDRTKFTVHMPHWLGSSYLWIEREEAEELVRELNEFLGRDS